MIMPMLPPKLWHKKKKKTPDAVQSPVMLQRQLSSRVPIRKLQLHIAYLRCSASCTHLAHAGEFGELMFESSVQEWLSARALAKELERVLRRRNGRPSTSSGSD